MFDMFDRIKAHGVRVILISVVTATIEH